MSDVIMVLFEETFLHDFPNSQKISGTCILCATCIVIFVAASDLQWYNNVVEY